MTTESEQVRRAVGHAVAALGLIPPGAPAAALMRHAERGEIPKGTSGNEVLLTPQGGRDAEEMGRLLRGRVSALRHSPVERCGQTALRIQRGADGPAPTMWLPLVHAFADDPGVAGRTTERMTKEEGFHARFILEMSVASEAPYPGFARPLAAAAKLAAQMMLAEGGLCVNITHDWLVNVAAARALGQEAKRPEDIGYLDALFLWEEDGRMAFYYQGKSGRCAPDFQREYDAFSTRRGPGHD